MSVKNNLIFETLFQSATEGIVVVDDEGVIVMVNPAAQTMFGYDESLQGKPIEVLLPDSLKGAHKKHRAGYHANPQARSMGHDLQLYGKRKDGSTFPVEISLSPSKIKKKPVVMAFIIDITERKSREDTVLGLGRIFNETLNEIFIFNAEKLNFIRVNQSAIQNLGYTKKELLGMTPVDIKPEYSTAKFLSLIKPLQEGVPKIKFETVHERKNGTTYPVEVHLQLTTFDSQSAYSAIILDISERKEAENKLRQYSLELESEVEERTLKLRESQKLYSVIARNFPDGMINVFDSDLRYVFVEGKELYALGITSETLIGTKYIDRLSPEIAVQTEKELMEVFDGQGKTIDIRYKNNDYVLEAVPLSDDNEDIKQILVIEKNVTEQKRVQDDIQRTLDRERQLNELKSRFVSMASHEFRTPLSTILSSVSLLAKYQTEQEQPKREKHIQRIKTSVHNLTGILNDFLSLDKLETGVEESNPVSFDLQSFAQDVCDQLAPTLKINQHIVYNHQGDTEVYLDKQILNNILLNLLSNASKYSDNGMPIDLSIRFRDHQIQIAVKDQGIGISKEDQNHLFERFFRAKNAINIQGTGLGLNIVKKYVDLLHGDINFLSEEGKGSTFIVNLKQNNKHEKDIVN